jgi:hypothetical protein
MKPLELVWYGDFRDDGHGVRTFHGPNKRLTDAELAAESYRAAAWIGAKGRAYTTDEDRAIAFEAAFTFGPETRDEHEWLVVHRFATYPHYDEDVAS